MKQLADQHRIEKEFSIGDQIYVKLQPYRQHSLKSSTCYKLSPTYFGPFPIVARIGKVAYQLQLSQHTKVHSTFHVSLLKKKISNSQVPSHLPICIATIANGTAENHVATQVLVKWSNTFSKDSTQEYWQDFQQKFLSFCP